jgi:hypothetical protein
MVHPTEENVEKRTVFILRCLLNGIEYDRDRVEGRKLGAEAENGGENMAEGSIVEEFDAKSQISQWRLLREREHLRHPGNKIIA